MNYETRNLLMRRSRDGQALLIGLLLVILIIAILGGIMYPKMAGRNEYDANGNKQGVATPIDRAYDVACTEYTQQVKQAEMQYRQDHGTRAPDLQSLKPYGVTDDIINTPNCDFGIPKTAAPNAATTPNAPGYPVAPAATGAPGQPAPNATIVEGGGVRVPVNTSAGAAGVDPSTGDGQ